MAAMRCFVCIDLGRDGVPDETTVCKFRHLLEKRGLVDQRFAVVIEHPKCHGIKLSQGTIVDPTIITAPPTAKNKGNQHNLGMKAHIGVDEAKGLVPHVETTAANVAGVTEVPNLLHGRERHVYGDAGDAGNADAPMRRSGHRNRDGSSGSPLAAAL